MERPPPGTNVNMKSMDSEREKFRTYVEKSGVMSALTDVLVRLYEEPNRPSDALAYIKETLGSINIDAHHVQMLSEKVKEQQALIESHEATIKSKDAEIESLKSRLAQAEPEDASKVPHDGSSGGERVKNTEGAKST